MDFLMDLLWNKEKKTFQAVKRAAWSFWGYNAAGKSPSIQILAEVVSMVVWGVSYREAPQVLKDEIRACAPVVKVFPRKVILETVSGRIIRIFHNQRRNGEKILLNAPKGAVVEFLAPKGSFALFCQIHKVLKEAPLYGILVSGTLLHSKKRTSSTVDEVFMSPLGRHLKNRDGINQAREIAWQWYYT